MVSSTLSLLINLQPCLLNPSPLFIYVALPFELSLSLASVWVGDLSYFANIIANFSVLCIVLRAFHRLPHLLLNETLVIVIISFISQVGKLRHGATYILQDHTQSWTLNSGCWTVEPLTPGSR